MQPVGENETAKSPLETFEELAVKAPENVVVRYSLGDAQKTPNTARRETASTPRIIERQRRLHLLMITK